MALAVPLGCGPQIDPHWLITTPTEIAVEVEVVQQGPLGTRIVPGPRTYRDVLPFDTVSLRPIIVDQDGPLDVDELEGQWLLCPGFGNCLGTRQVTDRPRCDGERFLPEEPCRFSEEPITALTLGGSLEELDPSSASVFSLLIGPTVAFIASAPDGPGLEVCIDRLEQRTRLDGCLLVERVLGVGPVADLVAYLTELGIDPGVSEEAEFLLATPRNRNPAVEMITVRDGSQTRTVEAGSEITVPSGVDIGLALRTTDDDLDLFTIEDPDEEEPLEITDSLAAQWWFDTPIDRDIDTLDTLSTTIRSNGQARTRAYVTLRESRRGEGWGYLDLVFEP